MSPQTYETAVGGKVLNLVHVCLLGVCQKPIDLKVTVSDFKVTGVNEGLFHFWMFIPKLIGPGTSDLTYISKERGQKPIQLVETENMKTSLLFM